MLWFARQTEELKRPFTRSASSIEYTTTVRGRVASANAVIERLSALECHFRSCVRFDDGDAVEFTYAQQPDHVVTVRGDIAARNSHGSHFTYDMRLERMSGAETNELAHTLAERHRRLAMARSTDSPVAGFTRARSRRADMRVLARFPIAYRESEAEFKDGKAGDVSAGGLLMTCDEKLTPGDLELRFTLPSMALEIYPQETHSIDLRKHPTTPLRSEAGRPFEEMHIGGRIVMHRRLGLGKYVYGLAFMAIDTYQREEIARYVHAVDLAHHHH